MSQGNGHKKNLPYSVNIHSEEKVPSPEEMMYEMWVDMKMVKIKMYGDKGRRISGIVDELESLNKSHAEINSTLKPLIDEREFAKKIVKGLIAICSIFGLGKIAQTALEHYLSKH